MNDSPINGAGHRSFIQWIKQPNSWLSVIAAIISLSTFYLVYTRKGEVKIIMPDKVGVSLSNGNALLLVPLTFTNTGAPRTVNYVIHVAATMRNIDPHEISDRSVDLHWRLELTTVDKWRWLEKNPEQKVDREYWAEKYDVVQYVGRALPFALYGGTSATKLFDFIQDRGSFQQSLRSFEIVARAETPSGAVSSKMVKYVCENAQLDKDYTYCNQEYH